MANLNSWQKIDRVLPKKPFGDGINGAVTISSDPNTRATIIGSSGSPNATAGSTAFANGDLVLLHQTRGTGAGQWEINRVLSGGGTTSLVFEKNNQYTYIAGAQIIKIPRYTTATINAHSVTAWNGSTGGIEVICAKTSITTGGVLNANEKGFEGGAGLPGGAGNQPGRQGGGQTGNPQTQTRSANGNGGGGSSSTGDNRGCGAGGGNGTAGANGGGDQNLNGTGGASVGNADLTTLFLGGAGGSGASDQNSNSGDGGIGGGIVILISKNIIISNQLNTSGKNGNPAGGNNQAGGSGGGAGGNALLICDTASIGTNNIISNGGTGSSTAVGTGGNGGVGRIAVHYKTSVTGTSTPASVNTQDPSLREGTFGLIY